MRMLCTVIMELPCSFIKISYPGNRRRPFGESRHYLKTNGQVKKQ